MVNKDELPTLKRKYRVVWGNNSMALIDSLQVLEDNINKLANDGYKLVTPIQMCKPYGAREVPVVVMEHCEIELGCLKEGDNEDDKVD